MTDEIPLDLVDPSEVGGEPPVLAGTYHVSVIAVNEAGGKNNNQLVVSLKVETEGPMNGRVHRTYCPYEYKKWCTSKRIQMVIVCGLATVDELMELREEGKSFDAQWQDAVGAHFGLVVVEDDYQGKKTYKSPFAENLLPIDDERVQQVLNKRALETARRNEPDPFAAAGDDEDVF